MDNLKISQHISRRYNEELEDIRSRVLAMGGLIEEQPKTRCGHWKPRCRIGPQSH